jgi:putative addiction module killer protein
MKTRYTTSHYLTADGRDIFSEWFEALRDSNAKTRITMRIDRACDGNFGDQKFLDEGVWEMRIDCGPGYRLYYCLDGLTVVLLLCGGDKNTQNRDILRAKAYKKDYERREKP